MRDNLAPPKYIMLSLYDDGTYNVDFFEKKEQAQKWKAFEEHKNNTSERKTKITIYKPLEGENE